MKHPVRGCVPWNSSGSMARSGAISSGASAVVTPMRRAGSAVQGRGLAEQERPRPAVAAVGAHEHGAARLGAVCESGHDPVVRGGEGRERFAPADVQARREQRAEPGAVEPLARARGDYVSRLQGLEVEKRKRPVSIY